MYRWNLYDLKKKRLILIKQLICNLNLSTNDRMKIKSDLNLLNDMISEIEMPKYSLFKKQELTYVDKDCLFPRINYDAFFKLPDSIISILLPITKEFEIIELQNYEYSYFNLNQDKIINSAHTFYQSLPNKKYYSEIEKYLNPNNNLLQFIYNSFYTQTTGNTFYYENPNKESYLLVRITNEIHDLLTLDHELAHAYFNKYNNLDIYKNACYYLTETEGLFFEYLKEEFLLASNQPKEDIYKKRIEHFNDFIELIINIYVGKVTSIQFAKTNEINEIDIMNILYKNGIPTEYDSNIIYDSISNYPRNAIKECIAYLTFLDLKNIANHDLEKALYLLENIRKNHNTNILSTLRKNEISFMNDNYRNLQKEYQKLKEYKL